MTNLAIIILAAGKGTRMKSDLPKVLHTLGGKPLITHVLNAAQALNPSRIIAVTGYGAEAVEPTILATHPHTVFVRQEQQKGTGHAVLHALPALAGFRGNIIILYGDVPLIQPATLAELLAHHARTGSAITVGTATTPNPTGLGRIITKNGQFKAIVEDRDCTPKQKQITEINTGIYVVQASVLASLLPQITPHNAQGEYYLTDIVSLAASQNLPVYAHVLAQPAGHLTGINTPEQLADAEEILATQSPPA